MKPTPHQVRAEAWMSIVHGSRGLIYFVHQFKPTFREAALLDDPEMLSAVTHLNRQIQELAPVINSPEPVQQMSARVLNSSGRVAVMSRVYSNYLYVFAVEMTGQKQKVKFELPAGLPTGRIEVSGEGRTLDCADRAFEDDFTPWDVHLYKLQR